MCHLCELDGFPLDHDKRREEVESPKDNPWVDEGGEA